MDWFHQAFRLESEKRRELKTLLHSIYPLSFFFAITAVDSKSSALDLCIFCDELTNMWHGGNFDRSHRFRFFFSLYQLICWYLFWLCEGKCIDFSCWCVPFDYLLGVIFAKHHVMRIPNEFFFLICRLRPARPRQGNAKLFYITFSEFSHLSPLSTDYGRSLARIPNRCCSNLF